ncbi:hypothetical protein HYV80_02125 [Candidatus Woesearchaeota archaeon]|nr:hypothetical protein [Candidatus Woesearchaeota archaeon]
MKFCKNINKWKITKEFLIQEYTQNKKSLPQIAEEIGMPYESLFWYKKKFGMSSHSASFWGKGRRNSPQTEFKKGIIPWNKGKIGWIVPWNKGRQLTVNHKKKVSIETKKAMARPEIKEKVQMTQFRRGLVPWNKGKKNVYSSETINQIREARLRQIFPKKSTNAELILFEILNELNLNFSKHKSIKTICQADAFVEPNIVLFADGDYWHSNPMFYPKPTTEAQIKNKARDETENNKLIKEGYLVIRFWEFDLINNKNKCKGIIKKLIQNG